jgi:HrpA-like RNA helicase
VSPSESFLFPCCILFLPAPPYFVPAHKPHISDAQHHATDPSTYREQGCKLGDTVGYQIRLDKKCSRKTRLLFCTTGILLRRMHGDPDLRGVTHVIVDEVHERNVDTDFLLAILRTLVHRKGSTVKVVLMSATMDAQLFVRYFQSSHVDKSDRDARSASKLPSPPPVISVPGFVYPVEELYLEDILERSGYAPRGAKGWRNAGTGDVDGTASTRGGEGNDGGSGDDDDDGPDPQDDGSKAVMPYALDNRSREKYSRFTQESLQKLSHGSHANHWEKRRGAATQQRTDYDLVAATVVLADTEALAARDDGAILVFMSGTMEISKAMDAIKRAFFGSSSRSGGGRDGYDDEDGAVDEGDDGHTASAQRSHRAPGSLQILPLHGSLTSADQQRIFRRPPRGVRKVVVATNIAETSITIDDCSVVIDSGRFKETRYDPTNRMACLVEAWVSQASSRQRRGRAGRVRKGRCYRLFTKSAYGRLPSSQDPEMHRVPLENMCLQIRLLGLGKPGKFLGSVIEPPPRKSIKAAVHHLRALGAFVAEGSELTPLGQHLARMPLDPQIGKMLVFGALMRCTEDVLTIAAALCSRSPFLSPIDRRDEANKCKAKLAGPSRSDHIALLRAYHGWENAGKGRRRYCDDNFLSYDGMRQLSGLRRQLGTALFDAGFGSRRRNGAESANDFTSLKSTNVLRAALCAGMYPNIIHIRKPPKVYYEMNGGNFEKTPTAKELKFYCRKGSAEEGGKNVGGGGGSGGGGGGGRAGGGGGAVATEGRSYDNERVFLHPASVNFKEGGFVSPWMVYFQKVKTSRVFIRDCTMVPPYAMLLFGGQLEVQHTRNKIVMDGWMYFDAPARVAVLIQELRRELDLLLGRKIEHPEIDISSSPLIDAIARLLVKAGY